MAPNTLSKLPVDDPDPEDEPKVFLSYARADREHAKRVAKHLRDRSFGVFRDTDDILPTEEWRDRLKQLIEAADTIVFLLSPHSAKSDVCVWEVEYATGLNKRIAPIVIKDVDAMLIPAALARLNFIFATDRGLFGKALEKLVSALNTDIGWIREHTRLAGLAARWHKAGTPGHLLLRGRDIHDAESWRDNKPNNAPVVLQIQAQFITASRRAANRRLRLTVISTAIVGVLMGGLALMAVLQGREIHQRAAVLAAEVAREVSTEGDPNGALTILLDASEAFRDGTAPHSLLIAMDEVLQRATAESRFTLPEDALLLDVDLGFFFYLPSTGNLLNLDRDAGELRVFATLRQPLIAAGVADEWLVIAEALANEMVITRYRRLNGAWQAGVPVVARIDGLDPSDVRARVRADGRVWLRVGNEDLLVDPTTGAVEPEGDTSEEEGAALDVCLAGFTEAAQIKAQVEEIFLAAEYSASMTCKRRGDVALVTLFETPNAGVIRRSYIVQDGWIEDPRTAMVLDHFDGDVRDRGDRGDGFQIVDLAEPVERTLYVVRDGRLESEPPLAITFEAKVVAARFLPGDRIAVFLGPRGQDRGRLVVIDPVIATAYRSGVAVAKGLASIDTGERDPGEIAYAGPYEVTDIYHMADPDMVVMEIHIGMSNVEAWMYSLQTGERWRKMGRGHNRVHVVVEEAGTVLAQDPTGTYRFEGLHSLSEAVAAAEAALPDTCQGMKPRQSPCWPKGFEG